MKKKIGGVTLEQVQNGLLVVVRWSTGYRQVMSSKEYLDTSFPEQKDDYIKDVDECAEQPEFLQDFIAERAKLEAEHGWMTHKKLFERFGK